MIVTIALVAAAVALVLIVIGKVVGAIAVSYTHLDVYKRQVYGGSRNAGKVAVLEEGMKYQQIGSPPEEPQFLETRKFQINEIARLYRIPPHWWGIWIYPAFPTLSSSLWSCLLYTSRCV